MSTVICRTSFCPGCEKVQRPHRHSVFLAYGSYRGKYYQREATRSGIAGYTPHLFVLKQVTTHNVCIVSMICAMKHCGVSDTGVDDMQWKTIFLSIADWNALVSNKRDPQYTV